MAIRARLWTLKVLKVVKINLISSSKKTKKNLGLSFRLQDALKAGGFVSVPCALLRFICEVVILQIRC